MIGRRLTPAHVEPILWLLLLAGLLVGIGYVSDWGRRWVWPVTTPASEPATLPDLQLASPFTMRPPDDFIEIALRPLFVPTRRPAPPAPPQEPPKPSMKKGQFILNGTTIVGGMKFAHLIEVLGGKPRVIAEGREINGIIVKQVNPTHVVMTQFDETEIVQLQTTKHPAQAGSGTPAVISNIPVRSESPLPAVVRPPLRSPATQVPLAAPQP